MAAATLKLKRLVVVAAFGGLAVVVAAAGGIAWLAFDRAPAVGRPADATPADIASASGLLRALDPNVDERGPLVVAVSERHVELLLDRLVRRWPDGGAARVELSPGAARLRASVAVPNSPFGGWLNVDAVFEQTAALPRLAALRVGRLPVPAGVAGRAAGWALDRFGGDDRRLVVELVRQVGFSAGSATVVVVWSPGARDRLVAALQPPADRERLAAYEGRLTALAASASSSSPGAGVSLATLLGPLFELARERTAAGGDAARENRAAILALALRAGANDARRPFAFPGFGAAPRPGLRITLAGRDDFPQHLLVSAALAIDGGGALADAVGLSKEIADTQGGSGFSFNDLVADRVGTRLGLLAVRTPRELQARLAAGVTEADVMPDVSDLPEFLAADEFRRRYAGAGAADYARLIARIEARVAALGVLR